MHSHKQGKSFWAAIKGEAIEGNISSIISEIFLKFSEASIRSVFRRLRSVSGIAYRVEKKSSLYRIRMPCIEIRESSIEIMESIAKCIESFNAKGLMKIWMIVEPFSIRKNISSNNIIRRGDDIIGLIDGWFEVEELPL